MYGKTLIIAPMMKNKVVTSITKKQAPWICFETLRRRMPMGAAKNHSMARTSPWQKKKSLPLMKLSALSATPCTCYMPIIYIQYYHTNLLGKEPRGSDVQRFRILIDFLQLNELFQQCISASQIRLSSLEAYAVCSIQVYCFSNQSMKKLQNLQQRKEKPSNIELPHSSESDNDSIALNKQKSIPKFNRKTQIKPISRKKSENNLEIDQAICYISPKRTNKHSIQLFRSPKFEDVVHKFAAPLFDSSTSRNSEASPINPTNESAVTLGRKTTRVDSYTQSEKESREEFDSLGLELQKMRKENKKIKDKLQEMENLESFLVQRQAFIYQLQENNHKLADDLASVKQQKQTLQQELESLRNQLTSKIVNWEGQYRNLQNKYDTQQTQINFMLKKNVRLKEEIKSLKYKGDKLNTLNKRFKENNENYNRSRKNSLTKSKSSFFQTAPAESFGLNLEDNSPLDISQIQPDLSANGNSQTVIDLCQGMQGTFTGSDVGIREMTRSDVGYPCANIINKPFMFDKERQDCHQTIKMLRQKVRYSQIEIDILKKLKLDTDKIQEENSKLKAHNRKLLNRIDFISRETRKRRCTCDSDLQLSLSPKRN